MSYFFAFVDDPTIDPTGSRRNVQRGAALLYATAEFRKLVCSGSLPYERVGKQQTPICATAYKYMFNACRIPRREQDSYRIYDPSRCSHCIVARKGFFFAMELVDLHTGDPLPVGILEDQLAECIRLADEIPTNRLKLGLLTSQNRDDSADAREELLRVGGIAMEEAFTILESGAILLNLDDEAPVSRQECGELFWTGGLNSGANRWFDKSIQIMVTNNGKAGAIMEHSMMDGMPVVGAFDFITKVTYAQAKKRSSLSGVVTSKAHVSDIFAVALSRIDPMITERLETKGMQTRPMLLVVLYHVFPFWDIDSCSFVACSMECLLQIDHRPLAPCPKLPGLWQLIHQEIRVPSRRFCTDGNVFSNISTFWRASRNLRSNASSIILAWKD